MPIYEYACTHCGNEFERLVRSSDAAPECPQCHGQQLQRKLSTFAALGAVGEPEMPAGCGRCGNPDGPCRFAQ